MKDDKLCPAGALLAQRLELGVKNIQEGAAEIKAACNGVAKTLEGIRDTTIALHTKMEDIERRADLNDSQTVDLGKQVEGHIGVHIGNERAGIIAGRRSGMIYGFVSAIVGSVVVAIVGAWQILVELGQ